MKHFGIFTVCAAALCAALMSCAEIDDNSAERKSEPGYGSLTIGDGAKVGARALDFSKIEKIDVEVMGSGMETIKVSNVDMAAGSGSCVVKNIPVGNNRIVKTTAKTTVASELSRMAGLDLYAVCDIKEGENSVSVDWATTAEGAVYAALLEMNKTAQGDEGIGDLGTLSNEVVRQFLPSGTHAALVDAQAIAQAIFTGSYIDKTTGEPNINADLYKIKTGSVTITSDTNIDGVTVQVCDPVSQTIGGLGASQTVHDVAPGVWSVYILKNGVPLYNQSATVASGADTKIHVELKALKPRLENQDGSALVSKGILEGETKTVYLRSRLADGTAPMEGVEIHYTLGDGEEPALPTKNSNLYDDSVGIAVSPGQHLKAVAFKSGMEDSDVLYEYEKFAKEGKLGFLTLRQGVFGRDTIEILWDKVKGADDTEKVYSAKVWYKDDAAKTPVGAANAPAPAKNGETFSFVMQKPDGWDSAEKAGKTLVVEVTASKEFEGEPETVTDTIETHLVGPAAVMAKAGELSDNQISVKWSDVEGANAYAVLRVKYADMKAQTLPTGDGARRVYLVEKSGGEYSINTHKSGIDSADVPDGAQARAGAAGEIELVDKYVEGTSSYRKQQAEIGAGWPYAYYILPLVSASDFNNVAFGVEYNKITAAIDSATYKAQDGGNDLDPQVVNSATGYGANVQAAKAQDDGKIHISWEVPYAKLGGGSAVVFRRRFNRGDGQKGEWTALDAAASITDGADGEKLFDDVIVDSDGAVAEGADPYASYEYAVSYKDTNALSIFPSYLKALENSKDGDARYAAQGKEGKEESRNKGYTSATSAFSAGPAARFAAYNAATQFYSEKITLGYWSIGGERILCPEGYTGPDANAEPDGYEIYIKNLNIDDSWHKIYSLLSNTKTYFYNDDTIELQERIAAQNVTLNEIFITPGEMASKAKNASGATADGYGNTGTNGLLKVLRDYKHYYKIVAKDAAGAEITAQTRGDDNSLWACRNITDEELVKCAMLTLAQGIEETEITRHGGTSVDWRKVTGKTGSFECAYTGGSETFKMDIQNYTHTWKNVPGGIPEGIEVTSPFKLHDHDGNDHARGHRYSNNIHYISLGSGRTRNFDDKYFATLDVTSNVNELSSCNATIKYCVAPDEIKIRLYPSKGTEMTLNIDNSENKNDNFRRTWCPAELWDGDHFVLSRKGKYYGEDKAYGWWPTGVAAPSESQSQATVQAGISVSYK